MPFSLSPIERAELVRRASSKRGRDARRARLILMLSQAMPWQKIMEELGCSRSFIARWNRRFREARMGGLHAHHHGGARRVLTARLEKRIVDAAREISDDGDALWTTRALGERLAISHMTVHRVWTRHGLR